MQETQEPIKGATILEPMKGVHTNYILVISASPVGKEIAEERIEEWKTGKSKEKYKDFDLIQFLQDTVMSNEIMKKYSPKILYGDGDFIHIHVSTKDAKQAYDVGNYISSVIANRLFDLTNIATDLCMLKGVADYGYYKAKKRYAIKYIWLFGHKVGNFIEFHGRAGIWDDLQDLIQKGMK